MRSVVRNISWALLLQLSAVFPAHTIDQQLPFFAANKAVVSTTVAPFLYYNIVHLSWVKKSHTRNKTSKATAKRKPSHSLVLALMPSLSWRWWTASITFTAKTNYLTGRPWIHCGPRNCTCPVFDLFLVHEMAITHEVQMKEEWCSVMFPPLQGKMPQISAMLNVACCLFHIVVSTRGKDDLQAIIASLCVR